MTPLSSIPEPATRNREQALQAVFERRYAWLLRWALHFAENDRAAAEDLVQETFVRLLLSWDTLHDLDDLEPLLYSYLRYAHLSERRRGRTHLSQRLSSADFDTLAISLRSSSAFDQIEVQHELREILAFLLWRRQSARFASMFILRFFHGFFPEEVASICNSKRFSVDLGLRQARRELKAHLTDSHRIRVLGRMTIPEQKSRKIAVPIGEFEEELRQQMLASVTGRCFSALDVERLYGSRNGSLLEAETLAHIVTCEACLALASTKSGTPPPSSRSIDRSWNHAPRGRSKKSASLDEQHLARVFAEGENRMREIYEHHPRELIIALNAEVVAVRDVHANAARATLKVETHSVQTLEIVEVFSEQGLLLLSIPLLHRPPKSQPEICHVMEMSEGRKLGLSVRFTYDGALIEATYEDPLSEEDLQSAEQSIFSEEINPERQQETAPPAREIFASISQRPARMSRWLGFLDVFYLRLGGFAAAVPIVAILMVMAALLISVAANHDAQRIDANQVLRAAVRASDGSRQPARSAAVVQRVRYTAGGKNLEREIHRDVAGKRRAKQTSMDEDERILRQKLAEAKLDWDDPLSAQNFRDWHDRLYQENDQVTKSGKNLLTVSTTVTQGQIAQQSITVQADNYHPVARTVLFRDGQQIEIAELSYQVVSWGPDVESWFEPDSESSSLAHPAAPVRPLAVAPKISDSELDVAELTTLLALHDLHAETERLQVVKSPSGVVVQGIVATDDRKEEISRRLHWIPHVKVALSSYRELEARHDASTTVSHLNQVTVTESDTPLKKECERKKVAPDPCRQLSYTLLNASSTLVSESNRIKQLESEYPPSRGITATARNLLQQVVQEHIDHMQTALQQQEQVIQSFGLSSFPDQEPKPIGTPFLPEVAQQDLTLTKELVYSGSDESRSAASILLELAQVDVRLRLVMAGKAAQFSSNTAPSSPDSTPRQ